MARLKDSDVTWLYGPLFNSAPPVPPTKVATTADKLNIIPHLPKGKKPILKRRTLAEVLVRGLCKATAQHTLADPDETREIDLIQVPLPKDASPDRLTLLRTTSDTNLLQPAGFTLTLTADEDASSTSGNQAKSALRQPRSRVHSTSHSHLDSTPGSSRSAGERHISFNTFVTQCIAIQPGEHVPGVFDEEEDEASRAPGDWEEALSITSSESHPRRPGLSRSNSHSSDLSERLTIAPIPPTMLKLKDEEPEVDDDGFIMGSGNGNKAAKENGHAKRAREGPVLVYAPPTGSDSVYAPRDVNHPGVVEADAAVLDYYDAGEHRRHPHHRYHSRHELPDGEIIVGGCAKRTHSNASQNQPIIDSGDGDGQVLYSTGDHQLGESAAEMPRLNTASSTSTSAVYASVSGASSTATLRQAQQGRVQQEEEPVVSIGGTTTPPIPIPRSPRAASPIPISENPYALHGTDERRGRTLARTSSPSSLNERVKNNAGSIGVSVGSIGNGSAATSGTGVDISPVGSLSPESSRASSSRGSSAGVGVGRGRGVSKLDNSSLREDIPSGLPATDDVATLAPSLTVLPTPPSPTSNSGTGLVDKAKGIFGTLLGHSSSTNTTAAPLPPSPHHSQL